VLAALGLAVAGCAALASANVAAGRKLAHDYQKGNCLACHQIPGDAQAVTSANIGPPLQNIAARFTDRGKLRAQIWDARSTNPDTVMPPFGSARILTEAEIEKIVDYLYSY
jgi:sulfur-oxidizing protein SoxX